MPTAKGHQTMEAVGGGAKQAKLQGVEQVNAKINYKLYNENK